MTVIVGIKATDGVVLAADGMASYGIPGGAPTIKQPIRKLSVHGSVILGCSGPVALSQAFNDELASIISEPPSNVNQGIWPRTQSANGFRDFVNQRLFRHVQVATSRAQVLQPILHDARNDALMGALFCFALNNTPQLVVLSPTCQPEFATDDLPFETIGSGQSAADPFLAFIRRCMWENQPLSLAEAKFAALWAVKHTCDSQPGFVGAPYQVVSLENRAQKWEAVEHTQEELQEALDRIDQMEEHIGDFGIQMKNTKECQASAIPEPVDD